MNLKEYLDSHPLISFSSLEVAIGLKPGTFKRSQGIPTKYYDRVCEVLRNYGYETPNTSLKEYVICINSRGEEYLGEMLGDVCKRVLLGKGTVVFVKNSPNE